MANPYKNKFRHAEDNLLLQMITSDFIYNEGIPVQFLPRTDLIIDRVMHEPLVSIFRNSYDVDVLVHRDSTPYIEPNPSFDFSGLNWGDDSVKIEFDKNKLIALTGALPLEGDLIFISELDRLYELTDIDTRDVMLSGGRHFTIMATMVIYSPSEGSQHFDIDLGSDTLDKINVLTNPAYLLTEYTDFSSTTITWDHNRNLLSDVGHMEQLYTFDADIKPIGNATTFDQTSNPPTFDQVTTGPTFDDDGEIETQSRIDDENDIMAGCLPLTVMNDDTECPDDLVNQSDDRNPFGFW